jgi:signal transduction histidine kinase
MLFSYLNYAEIPVTVGNNMYSNIEFSLLFCIPVTLLSVVIGFLVFYLSDNAEHIIAIERLNIQLKKINRDIMNKMFSLRNNAMEEERMRISKEVHDTTGYIFVNIIMMLQAVQAILYKDQKRAETLITDTRDYTEKGINEIRYALREIRNYKPDYLSIQNALFDISASFIKATGVAVDINYGDWPDTFGKDLDSFFMAFMQETLTNAIRHGNAANVTVQCRMDNDKIVMGVHDDGSGCRFPLQKGIGISSIEAYVHKKNGSLGIYGEEGFKITVSVPWDKDKS